MRKQLIGFSSDSNYAISLRKVKNQNNRKKEKDAIKEFEQFNTEGAKITCTSEMRSLT